MTLPLFAACAGGSDPRPTPFDDEHDPSADSINDGAPANDSLPDDNKADAIYPAQFEVKFQSPVKSQGSRGVCSIFSATAQVENLYIKAGLPVEQADFSEQYLQWAAKNLQGAFRNTEGSSSDANLQAVVRFGTIREAEWPYESFPWGAANDPACTGGENLPTKCYTNGEPPASVAQAPKVKLPSSRWINTNSIKAHITAKGTGINVGMTFFYQAWNHRRSTLPVDSELWRQGVVTYPNADDKTESAKHRAGHAIHIVGWDDTKEVVMRDKDGNPVVDATGNPRTEKGFWIFKNSWGTFGFGIDHPSGPGYGWLSYRYVQEYGSAVAAEIPVLDAPTAEVCNDTIDNDGDAQIDCADPDCAADQACTGGGTAHAYNAAPAATIPDNSPAGASSTIDVADTGTLAEVKVTVDITHTYVGDLRITVSKDGVSKTLADRVGGSADNLQKTFVVTGLTGQANAGAWTLKVEDTAATDVGTLNSWKLETRTN